MPHNKTEQEIETEMDMELRNGIKSDLFSQKSALSQFLYTHIPPFSTAQKEADIADCNKSFIAACLFNQKKLATGVKPISFETDEIQSCKRLTKKK